MGLSNARLPGQCPLTIDYDSIAPRYDDYRRGGGPFFDKLVSLATQCAARRVLEVGCGTGNNTLAFSRAHPCTLVALDISAGMLEQAKRKPADATWLRASAHHIPLADASVDFVFGCYVLHYLHPLPALFQECARVLRAGAAVFVTAPLEFIERHPMNRYFPSFAPIERARFHRTGEITSSLAQAGFEQVRIEHVAAAPRPIDHRYLEQVEGKHISTFDLIPKDEYAQGLARLRADIAATGRLDVDLAWEALVVYGFRSAR